MQKQPVPILKKPHPQTAVERKTLFLGITLEDDKNYGESLKKVFRSGFGQANESKEMLADFDKMSTTFMGVGDWKLPNTHHVTSLWIGGQAKKMTSDAFVYFKPNASVDVTIRALIYVPDKIVAGLCFPRFEIENKHPHVTLMVSSTWAPRLSNNLISATCSKGGPFSPIYEAASQGILPAKGKGIEVARKVKVEGKGMVDEVVFVLLRDPVKFRGKSQAYY